MMFNRHVICVLIFLMGVLPPLLFAIPSQLSYQGKLTDSSGVPIHGAINVTFTLYDSPTSNSVLWRQRYDNQTQPVVLHSGHFDVQLGAVGSPLSPSIFESDTVFLGIQIEDDVELSPRIRLLTSPYAFQAYNAERLGGLAADQFLGPQVAAPGQLNATANPIHWTQLKGVPNSVIQATDSSVDGVRVSGNLTKTLTLTRSGGLPDLVTTFNVGGEDTQVSEQQVEAYIANGVDNGYLSYSNGITLLTSSVFFSNGNIGISTTSPRSALDVSGSVMASGALLVSGNGSIDGNFSAASFSGDGSNLSNLDASTISSGTLSTDRLPSSVSLLGETISSSEIVDGTITNLDISDGAAIAASKLASTVLVEGDAISTLANDAGYITSASTVAGLVRSSEASSNYVLGTLGVGTDNPAASLDVRGSAIIRGATTVDGTLNVPHSATLQSLVVDQGLHVKEMATVNGTLSVGGTLSASGPVSSEQSLSAPIATLTTLNVTSITAGDVSADSLIVTDVTANAIVATTVSGDGSGLTSLQAVQLNGILSIPQGGTGALSSANALRNLGGLPLSGGDLSGPLSVPTNSFSVGDSQFVVSSDAVSIQGPLSVSSTTNVDAIRFSDGSSLRSASALQGLSSSSLSDAAGRPNALLIDNEGNVRIATDNTAARLAVGGDIVADRFIGAVSANQLTGAIPVSRGGTGVSSIAALSDSLNLATLASRNTVSNDLWDANSQLAVAHGGTGASTPAGARTALELGTLATLSSVGNAEWAGGALTIANGGTGATSSANALAALGGISSAGGTFSGSVSLPNNGLAVGTTLVVTDNKVGIGTNTPEQTLDVNGSAYVRSGEIIIGDTADSRSSIERTDNDNFGYNFRHNTATTLLHEAPDSSSEQVLFLAPSSASSSDPLFGISIHDGTAWRPRMTLSGEGKLGVGVITPTAAIHVNGTIQATAISADGSDITSLNTYELIDPVPLELGGTGHTTSEDVKNRFRTILELGQLAYTDAVGSDDWDPNDVLTVDKGGTGADNAEEARGNLGLGDLAAMNSIGNAQWTPGEVLSIANGGTGAANVSLARLNLGAVFKGGDTMTGTLTLPNGGLTIGGANSQIKTTYDAGTQTQRLGIMTAAPDYTLDVAGDIGMDGTLFHNGNAAVNLAFGTNVATLNAGANTGLVIHPQEFAVEVGGLSGLSAVRNGQDLIVTLGDQNTSSNLNDTVFVRGKQHSVGIGVDNPTATLDVNGTLRVSSTAQFDLNLSVDGTINTGQGAYELYGTQGDLLSGTGISITGGGDDVLYGTDRDIRITHADTSSLNSFTVTPGYVVTGLDVDGFGHVQGYRGTILDDGYAPVTPDLTLGFAQATQLAGTWTAYTPPAASFARLSNSTRQTNAPQASLTFNVPNDMRTAFMSFVTGTDGGFINVFLVKEGTAYFYQRIGTKTGATTVQQDLRIPIASGLQHYDAVRIQNGAGTFRFTGLAFSRQDLPVSTAPVEFTMIANVPKFATGNQAVGTDNDVQFKSLLVKNLQTNSGAISTFQNSAGRLEVAPSSTGVSLVAKNSSGSAHKLSLNPSGGFVGIGIDNPSKPLDVVGDVEFSRDLNVGRNLDVTGNVTIIGSITTNGGLTINGDTTFSEAIFSRGVEIQRGLSVSSASVTGNFSVKGDVTANGRFVSEGPSTLASATFTQDVVMQGGLSVTTMNVTGNLSVGAVKLGNNESFTSFGQGLTVIANALRVQSSSVPSNLSLSGTNYVNGLNFDATGFVTGYSTANMSGNFLPTVVEWTKGFADRATGSGSAYTTQSSPAWGFPRFKPTTGVHGAWTNSVGVTAALDFDIPSGAKSAYLAMATSTLGGYVDVWLRLSVDNTWIYHRRIHNYQNVQHNHDNDVFTKGGNIVVLAATGLDDQWGNRRYDRVRLRNEQGRFQFMGLGFTREDLTGGQDSGFVHWNNVFGDLKLTRPITFNDSATTKGLLWEPSDGLGGHLSRIHHSNGSNNLELMSHQKIVLTDMDFSNGQVSGNSFVFDTSQGNANFVGNLTLGGAFISSGNANSNVFSSNPSTYGFTIRNDSDYFSPGTSGYDAVIFEKTHPSQPSPLGGFIFANRGSGQSEAALAIRGDGAVGIGTITPQFSLDVHGDSGSNVMMVRSDSTTNSGDVLGAIGFDSLDGALPTNVNQSSTAIIAYSAEDHGPGDKGGILTFRTAPINQNSRTESLERLRIDSAGRIGINHPTNNNSALSVRYNGELVRINDSANDPSIELRDQDADGTGPFIDFVNDDVADFDARLQLVADGKLQLSGASLGIGINPSYPLHVSGLSKLSNVGIQANPNTDYHITLGGSDLGINMGNKAIVSANRIGFNLGPSFADTYPTQIAMRSGNNDNGSLALESLGGANKGELHWDSNGFSVREGGQTFFRINTNNSLDLYGGNTQLGVRVATNGDVGIKTSPSYALDVNGDAKVSSRMGIGTNPPSSGSSLKLGGHIDMNDKNLLNTTQIEFSNGAKLSDASGSNLKYHGASSGSSSMTFYDAQGNRQGGIFTDGHDTTPKFGLLDGDGNYAVEIKKDDYIKLHVNTQTKFEAKTNEVKSLVPAKFYVNNQLKAEVMTNDVRFYVDGEFTTGLDFRRTYYKSHFRELWKGNQHAQSDHHVIGNYDFCSLSMVDRYSQTRNDNVRGFCEVYMTDYHARNSSTTIQYNGGRPRWTLQTYVYSTDSDGDWEITQRCGAICINFY